MDNKLDIKAFLDKDEQKDLLRLLTAGSVDDGKSTLIGRLLFDSKKLYEDQLDALERDSKRVGNAGEHIDYALLLDGLKAEREQGITIDVAYRYFSTNGRKFIIADTPGHEQYTRNMITGGSTANLAIILVDARTGVITQTRRHTFLVSLLGIKHVVLAVNKVDSMAKFGNDVYDLTRYVGDFYNQSQYNKNSRVVNAWTPTNTNTDIPRVTMDDPNNNIRPSSYYVQDASFVRLKNMKIGYSVPQCILSKIKFNSLYIYAQATNLFTITGYDGIDPEVGLQSYSSDYRNLDMGVDRGIYPLSRTFTFGVNVSF